MPDRPAIDASILMDTIPDGVFVCTKSGELLYCNRALSKMFGCNPEDLLAKNLARDIVERPLEWQAMVSLLEQGSHIHDYEMKFRRIDGTVVTASLTTTFQRHPGGTEPTIVSVVRDISTRKGVENELREKAFRTDIVNRIARATSASKDVPVVLARVVEELRKVADFDQIALGVLEENGRLVDVFVPDPENRSKAKTAGRVPFEGSLVERLKYGGSAIIAEREAGRKPFTEFSLLDSATASSLMAVPLTSRGRVLGALSLISARQGEYGWQSAEALQMVADLLAGMVDNISLTESLERRVRLQETLVNSSLELQRAISTEEIYAVISRHIRDIIPYKDLSFYVIDVQRNLVTPVYAIGGYEEEIMAAPGRLDEGIVGIVARSGRAEFVDDVDADPRSEDIPGVPQEHNAMLAIPLKSSEGVIGVLELYRDADNLFTKTDLEAGLMFAQQASVALANAQLVSKLQDAKKEIEMLNDLMFHDIKNYNFATMNYIDSVAKSKELARELRPHLDKSMNLMRQNARLIENVKKLTKIGVMNPDDFVAVNLSDVIRKVVSATSTSTPDKTLSVELKIPEEAFIRANALVEELFVNLLGNAVKYDPHDDVEIDLEVAKILEEDRPHWKISIADHGYGIPDNKKNVLFQRYTRLRPDSKVAGAGLGLSICNALVDKFGGRIWVEDRVPGNSELGARFVMVFPAVRHPEQ